MTKEELFQLIKQEKKDRRVVVTFSTKEQTCVSVYPVREIKVNLTRNRIELSIDDC
jgi:hypothetical protein